MKALLPLLLLACSAPPLKSISLDPYPSERYLSELGRGGDPQAAERDARALLAAHFHAEVRAWLESVEEERDGQHQSLSRRYIEERIIFLHGDLIQIVSSAQGADSWEVRAVLERAALLERLEGEYRAPALAFRAQAQAALQAKRSERFTPAYRAAARHWALLLPLFRSLQLLESPEPAKDLQRWEALIQARERQLSRSILLLPGSWPEPAQRGLMEALSGLGLKIQQGGSCLPEGLSLKPEGEINCDRSSLGPRCRFRARLLLKACQPDHLLLPLEWELKAIHPSDEEQARRALRGKLAQASKDPSWLAPLSSLLPLEISSQP